jgi:photosystem II stability/assembly factor-like uncharacterized protein
LLSALVVLGISRCQPPEAEDGPLVRLHLAALDAAATRIVLRVSAHAPSGEEVVRTTEWNGGGPYDLLGVTFPAGTHGDTSFHIEAYRDTTCLLGIGEAGVNLDSDRTFEVAVPLKPPLLPCGVPAATLTVEVVTGLGAAGSVTSQPAGISCESGSGSCEKVLQQGDKITLHAQASRGSFLGWSGGGCSGVNDCTLRVSEDTDVQALFSTCSGWCPEQSGTARNLYGVWGTSPSNVVAVGQGGTILKWNGKTWTEENSGLSVPDFHAVSVPIGDTTIIVVGDSGYVLYQAQGTQTWARLANLPNTTLRGVAGAQPSEVYIVGSGGAYYKGSIQRGFSRVRESSVNGRTLNAISAQKNAGEHFLVGNFGYSFRRYSLLGIETYQDQNTGTGSSLYGVYTGPGATFAVGDKGTIISRPSSGASNGWTVMNAGSPSGTTLRAVWGSGDSNVYAVGDNGLILRFDGSKWNTVPSGTTQNLSAVWGTSPNNVYAVGDSGLILHYLQ